MSQFQQLFQSAAYHRFMKKIFWWSLCVLVVGIIFWFLHWTGGLTLVIVGGGCLIIRMIFFLIEKLFFHE